MSCKISWIAIGLMAAVVGCGDDSGDSTAPPSFASEQRIVYSDGLHNENTEMIKLGDRILLIFRGGEQGQVGSAVARIKIFESTDGGHTFSLLSEVNANNLPGGRDIRDPKLVAMHGTLFLYAISRVPGAHYRDLFGKAETLRAESIDGGRTWTAPVPTYQAGWGFWRFTRRQYVDADVQRETLYATGYNDGDTGVGLFASDDGVQWARRAIIFSGYADVPSETELQFFGANNEKAVALVRLDNQDILADGQTAICTSTDPFTTWECGRRIEQRLDGPTWVVRRNGNQTRNFVFARKHLPCTFKRTAAYELRGDLTDPNAPIEVCEIQELKSSGDTAYTSVVTLSLNESLLAWYSSTTTRDVPWLEGQFTPSDIWLANVHFDAAPADCVHPAAKRPCTPPPLPPGTTVLDITGQYLLTLAPVIWPAQSVFFQADIVMHGPSFDFSLQTLDAVTKVPVGLPWTVSNVPIADDGSFTADFGIQSVFPDVYPLLNDPALQVALTLTGKTTSRDSFCGNAGGYGQVLGTNPADRIGLNGSTFGAARIVSGVLPSPVSSCIDRAS